MRGTLRFVGIGLAGIALLTVVAFGVMGVGDTRAPAPTPIPPVHFGVFTVRLPETPHVVGEPQALAIPPLIQLDPTTYTPHDPRSAVTAPDGRPIAQLRRLPANLQALDVIVPATVSVPQGDELRFVHLASVRYTIAGQQVLVTTHRPAPTVARRTLVLGRQTVQLVNGATAWLTMGLTPPYPGGPTNHVVLVWDDLLISVAGDLPADQLEALAAGVTITR